MIKYSYNIAKPLRDELRVEDLISEQNYKHPKSGELEEIIKEANIEESIEDLLEMI